MQKEIELAALLVGRADGIFYILDQLDYFGVLGIDVGGAGGVAAELDEHHLRRRQARAAVRGDLGLQPLADLRRGRLSIQQLRHGGE